MQIGNPDRGRDAELGDTRKRQRDKAEDDERTAAPGQRPRRGDQRDLADRLLRQAAARRPGAERGAGSPLHAQRAEPEHKAGQPARRRRRHRRGQSRVDRQRERVQSPAGDKAVHRRHPRLQLARLRRSAGSSAQPRQMQMRQRTAPHHEQPGRQHDDADDDVKDLVEPFEHGHAFGALDAMQAGVVVTSLHDRGAKLCGQDVLKKRNVFLHQLLLQIFGSG